MSRFRAVAPAVALTVCAILLTSCGLLTAPDPEINTDARPVKMMGYAPTNLLPGGGISGGVFVRFRPEDDSLDITSVQLFVDDNLISVHTSLMYEYYFDTREFQGGMHNLVFQVRERAGKGELLSLLNSPARIYTTTADFQQLSVPPAPHNVQFHWVFMGHPYITWDNAAPTDSLTDHIVIERTYPTRLSATIPSSARRYDDTSIVCITSGFAYLVGAANGCGVSYTECAY